MPGSSEFKRYQDMVGLNGKQFDSGIASQGDQEAKQRLMQNMMTAHHLDPNAPAGDLPFTEPSLEDLVEMVRQGKVGKEVLGPEADIFLQYGTPSQREKQLKDTGSLEIPIQNYIDAEKKLQMMPDVRDTREGPDEDDLAFLKDFINKKMG